MFLTPSAVLRYLESRRLAEPKWVVDETYEVVAARGRNRTFLVRFRSSGLAVKQVRFWSYASKQLLERESDWYWRTTNDPRMAPMRPYVPGGRSWDASNHILVIELVPLTSITEMDAPEIFHPQRAKLLGEAMATLHGSMTWAPNDPEMIDRYPCEIPPFLDAASILSLGPFQDDGADSISRKDFLRACRSLSALEPALDQLRESWRCETLIHSDWKLANCLADPADPAAAPKIIDWESCDLGDPAWDCATLLQSYWTYWMTQPKLYDLTAIRPAAQAFWDGYCAKRGYDEAHSAAERTRAVRFAGARLIQTAWEWLDGEEQMTASAIRLLQASSNILKNPDAAEKMLFGDAAA